MHYWIFLGGSAVRPLALICFFLSGFLIGCSQDDIDSAVEPVRDSDRESVDDDNDDSLQELADLVRQLSNERGLTGDAAPGSGAVTPDNDSLVKLGQLLFFSTSLSGMKDVACASCHHPELAMGDGLSLSIGTGAKVPHHLGKGRSLLPERDLDPREDSGPNVPRNSQTIFNVSLYNRSLFHDGRLFVIDEEEKPGGEGQQFQTPESGNLVHMGDGENLLEVQALFPLVNNREMRAFSHPEMVPEDYRTMLVERLRDSDPSSELSWHSRFEAAFPETDDPINLGNIQRALAAYQASLLFVDNPWSEFLRFEEEDDVVLSEEELRGAWLFLAGSDQGGMACYACHSGDRFTNESFFNVGFPQIGRGQRQGGVDRGRWGVTQDPSDHFRFRVPSLLNIEVRAPYGHSGSFATLEDLVLWHSDPEYWHNQLDRFLLELPQFHGGRVLTLYPNARRLTEEVIEHETFQEALEKLPESPPTNEQVDDLVSFLETLTDPCVEDAACLSPWTPDLDEDPDGQLLVKGETHGGNLWADDSTDPSYPDFIALDHPSRPARDTFPDVVSCSDGMSSALNHNEERFVHREDLNLDDQHGFSAEGWVADGQSGIEMRMFSGGISAAYINTDCWPDLIFTGGEDSGLLFYENLGGQNGFSRSEKLSGMDRRDFSFFTNVSLMDLNGDFYQELLVSNISPDEGVPVLGMNEHENYQEIARLPMSRSTWGLAFSDFEQTGYPGFFMAHWSGGADGLAPALWVNEGGDQLLPSDEAGGTSSAYLDQNFNFAPIFSDLTGNAIPDLLIASDFGTSSVLMNSPESETTFVNVTDGDVITDENGMGAVVGDFQNNGKLDWFVTSIFDRVEDPIGNWGTSGNRLYRNVSQNGGLEFEDVTEESGVRKGGWGWGACAADFNNNGFLDIFHVNGFGRLPASVYASEWYEYITGGRFMDNPPVLFMNNGDGTFEEKAIEWNLDVASQGTGVACLDYDRDGDVDIVLVDNSSGIQFFENQVGHGAGARFLNVRLVGQPPNTHALGAKVEVSADVGNGHGFQRQMRESMAHSSFNGQNLPNMHFGMGEAEMAEIRVMWPDGEEQICSDVPVNQFLVIDQRESGCPHSSMD
ncbi:cytochrome c peroxidase [Natronospira proteinivora]|uniref:Cytochrome c peroxidase n=1 Tax=Natronospira proteinivora TaxID=1807133 RepID=A0ABT1G6K6_9GAMM|nr:cytochrome c peroxidase [Natronospira proteinivora]MCP1726921.1 cytochrome c peroxidase [Natronospira proteinivora]